MRSCHIEGSIHKPDFRTDFWIGKKWNEVVGLFTLNSQMGEGSSNTGSSNSVSEQWSSNSGRPKGVVKQGVVKQCQ